MKTKRPGKTATRRPAKRSAPKAAPKTTVKAAVKSAPKSSKSGLDAMNVAQLVGLQKRVDQMIEARHEQERSALRQKVQALAERAGFSVSELFSGRPAGKGNRRKSSVPVKFRHPKDPSLTWTGRGRKPRWIVQAGGNIERFRIA